MSRPNYRQNEIAGAWDGRSCDRPSAVVFNARRNGAAWLWGEVEAVWAACGAFEWIALGYLGMSSALILLFARNLQHPGRILGVRAFVAILVLVLCRVEAQAAEKSCETFSTKWWHFWRHWYPHLFFLFCFEELGELVHLMNPGWEDAKLIAFDHRMTGVHPPVWLEQFATPARNEFMQFAYLTYFVYLLVLGGILYYRRDWHAYWSVMTYSAAGYAIGYVIAVLFPVESPWFAMAGAWHGELRGGAFTATINFIEHFGRVRGAAFPSEHVAGAFAALWGAWRHRRWLFWVMLPLVLCMCVSTVWGRYHYVADVFGGMVTGTLGYVIGRWIMKVRLPVRVTEMAVAKKDAQSRKRRLFEEEDAHRIPLQSTAGQEAIHPK